MQRSATPVQQHATRVSTRSNPPTTWHLDHRRPTACAPAQNRSMLGQGVRMMEHAQCSQRLGSKPGSACNQATLIQSTAPIQLLGWQGRYAIPVRPSSLPRSQPHLARNLAGAKISWNRRAERCRQCQQPTNLPPRRAQILQEIPRALCNIQS